MAEKSQHVIKSSDGRWSVRRSGASRSSRTFAKQRDALSYARTIAKKGGSDLYIHNRDGTIREVDSYSHDLHPRKPRKV